MIPRFKRGDLALYTHYQDNKRYLVEVVEVWKSNDGRDFNYSIQKYGAELCNRSDYFENISNYYFDTNSIKLDKKHADFVKILYS